MFGCSKCNRFQDFIDTYRMIIYFIAVGLYAISYFSTMTRSFDVFVDGRSIAILLFIGLSVYSRSFGQRLDSLEVYSVLD